MTKRNHKDYLQDIINSFDEIEDFLKGYSFSEFKEDQKTINAVVRSLEIAGEAAKKIPDKLRSKYSNIPWRKMAGMRDKLIHEYSGVDLEIVWQTAKKDIKEMKADLKKIKKDL